MIELWDGEGEEEKSVECVRLGSEQQHCDAGAAASSWQLRQGTDNITELLLGLIVAF